MSDTPISDSTPHNVADLGMLCRRLERELNAANKTNRLQYELITTAEKRGVDKSKEELNAANAIIRQQQLLDEENLRLQERIKRLEEALGCVVVGCNHLHHRKKHQHRSGEPCPVEELIRKAKEAKL
jgi:hypothetical protein